MTFLSESLLVDLRLGLFNRGLFRFKAGITMKKIIQIKLSPEEVEDPEAVRREIGRLSGAARTGWKYRIIRRSIDARSGHPFFLLSLEISDPADKREEEPAGMPYRDVHHAHHSVLIAGTGPSGLFAALKLIQEGIKPILIDRGKDIRARRRDLASLNRTGTVDPDSNYCFGEGGAGTYSDGKLFTRAEKRGDVRNILAIFRHFGAGEQVLYDAHPHIGTNKLPGIISAITGLIIQAGGEIHYSQRITDLVIRGEDLKGVRTAAGNIFSGSDLMLCTGHSARDIFQLLCSKKILLYPKPFALGVRVEHPQALIDKLQYHCEDRGSLPPASYRLVQQLDQRSVFSFCMCPGGIIAPAGTGPGELVVNGWSPSKRNNPFANSGIVVQIGPDDWKEYSGQGPLAGMYYQQAVEQRSFSAGGGLLVAPGQRMTDFVTGKSSSTLPACSYIPGLRSVALGNVLPAPVYRALQKAFKGFERKKRGYLTSEAVVVATESRTSSPVQIPRDARTLQHPQLRGLYPCGEGAGFAGGIMSAAMDGVRCAEAIIQRLRGDHP
jgi:uncharacterized FAD-dependent dehydrogenase